MRIMTSLATAIIVFAANIDLVSAADPLATLKGVEVVPMSLAELDAVKGKDHHFFVTPIGTGVSVRHDTDQFQDANGAGNFRELIRPGDGTLRSAAPGYLGLILHACLVSPVISGPSSSWC